MVSTRSRTPNDPTNSSDSTSTSIEPSTFEDHPINSGDIKKTIINPTSNHIRVDTKEMMVKANNIVAEATLNLENSRNDENSNLTDNQCNIPGFFDNLSDICKYCEDNPDEMYLNSEGKSYMNLLDGRSKQYIASKKSILSKFFEILAKHSIFRHFCTLLTDPTFVHRELPLFFIKIRGPKTEEKKYLLNQMMLWFSVNLKKKGYEHVNLLDEIFTPEHAEACYQPSSVETRIKELFAQFKEQGIIFSYVLDFRYPGGYSNFFDTLWDKCQKFRSDFGTLPMASTFDSSSEIKIRQNGNYDYKGNYNDCLELMVHNVLKLFQLRGGKEVRKLSIYFIFVTFCDVL